MQIQQLLCFYHAARLRSITKAGQTLGLGQPTVTTHLRNLEEELGVVLFDRVNRPITLTSGGADVLEMIAPIVNGMASLKAYADDPERRGSLNIAAYSDLVLHYLPSAAQAFSAKYPDVHIRLMAKHHEAMISAIKSGEVDLALSTGPPVPDTSLEFVELFQSPTMLLTPLGHELLDKQPVQLADIGKWPLILYFPDTTLRTRLERGLADQGIEYEIVMEMENAEFVKRYVRIGMGIGICGKFCLEPGDFQKMGVVEINHLLSQLTIGMYTLKGKFQGPAVLNFIDGLKSALSQC